MRKIQDINELHNLLLGLAKSFHEVCKKNDIPYYLAYGSLLGAVRHKGFIPWDDDMDFAIKSSNYQKLLDALQKDLPKKYKVISRNDKNGVAGGYLKIVDTTTIVVEEYLNERDYTGVFIDIFLLYPATGKTSFFSRYFSIKCIRYIQMNRFYKSRKEDSVLSKGISGLIKFIFFWLKRKTIPDFMEKYLIPSKGDYLSAYITIYNKKDIIPTDYYGVPKLYKFESIELYGVEDYDSYLKHIYGDYMKLPPVEKRRVHMSEMYYLD